MCAAYWFPLYAYVCRRGHSPADAQDLTQAFFTRFLERRDVRMADPERGRFRSFLLGSMKHFLANEWDREQAQKRGGGVVFVPMAPEEAEQRYRREASTVLTAEALFERKWAMTLLDRTFARLEAEFARAGKAPLFLLIKEHLTESRPGRSHAEIAAETGMTEGAVKVTVHRMRRRFRDLLRAEVAETVEDPGEIDDEVRHLMAVLGGGV